MSGKRLTVWIQFPSIMAARGLRRVLSSYTQTLGSMLRIPMSEWTVCIPRSLKALRGTERLRNQADVYKCDSEIRISEGFELHSSFVQHNLGVNLNKSFFPNTH
jgi:hypothetical protein